MPGRSRTGGLDGRSVRPVRRFGPTWRAWMWKTLSAIVGRCVRPIERTPDVASIILYCSRCWSGYASIGEIPARCPACDRVTRWATSLPVDQPKVPWKLEPADRRLLQALKIQADEPEVNS